MPAGYYDDKTVDEVHAKRADAVGPRLQSLVQMLIPERRDLVLSEFMADAKVVMSSKRGATPEAIDEFMSRCQARVNKLRQYDHRNKHKVPVPPLPEPWLWCPGGVEIGDRSSDYEMSRMDKDLYLRCFDDIIFEFADPLVSLSAEAAEGVGRTTVAVRLGIHPIALRNALASDADFATAVVDREESVETLIQDLAIGRAMRRGEGKDVLAVAERFKGSRLKPVVNSKGNGSSSQSLNMFGDEALKTLAGVGTGARVVEATAVPLDPQRARLEALFAKGTSDDSAAEGAS